MSLPNSYLVTINRVEAYFDALLNAEPPDRFTYKFIENLGFTSSNDRLLSGVLKELGFLDDDGVPTERYYQFLDRSQYQRVLAQGIRDSYSDLFAVNKDAAELDQDEVINKLRTLYAGSKSDNVIERIGRTFKALCALADFTPEEPKKPTKEKPEIPSEAPSQEVRDMRTPQAELGGVSLDSLQYHINIVLPETRDQGVYDAIFRSLREHLG